MCGIACVFNVFPSASRVRRMLRQIDYRGEPSGRGEVGGCDPYTLGANRLAIVDRSNGTQPVANEDGSVLAVLNGEIYNHAQLRAELTALGHRFGTSCDTEVLAHGYEQWGSELTKRLVGMFAFAVAEPGAERFVVARDPFGIKPLHFRREGAGLVCASEAKCLLAVDPAGRGVGPIEVLKPGHQLARERGGCGVNLTRYWERRSPNPINEQTPRECTPGRLLERLRQAVARRVQTDLRIGVFFGGGVDSAIILALAKDYRADSVGLAVGLAGCEDVRQAQWFAGEVGVPVETIQTTPRELIGLIPEVIRHAESFEPNMVRNSAFSYVVSRRAHEMGLKVCLCGEGADELFAGYPEFRDAMGKGPEHLAALQHRFLTELNATQLQRVDRMAMAHTLEVRVPFLDLNVASLALDLPRSCVMRKVGGDWVDKWVLREAARDLIPEQTRTRRKSPISEGAGAGGNAPHKGLFYEHAEAAVSDADFQVCRKKYPAYNLVTKEEVLYFRYFEEFGYAKLDWPQKRPTVNRQ